MPRSVEARDAVSSSSGLHDTCSRRNDAQILRCINAPAVNLSLSLAGLLFVEYLNRWTSLAVLVLLLVHSREFLP
jgi:hypothetical protein